MKSTLLPRLFVIISFLGLLLLTKVACKSSASLGSSLSQSEEGVPSLLQEKIADDCFAWKVTLATTLHRMIHRKAIEDRHRRQLEENHPSRPWANPQPPIDLETIVPADQVKKVIDAIIQREGGTCAKELVYGETCTMSFYRGDIKAISIGGWMTWDYFSRIMDMRVNDPAHVLQMKKALQKDVDSFPNTRVRFALFSTPTPRGVCQECVRFSYRNNFGLCMLKKHESALEAKGLFSFGEYIDDSNVYRFTQDIIPASFQKFLDKTAPLPQVEGAQGTVP